MLQSFFLLIFDLPHNLTLVNNPGSRIAGRGPEAEEGYEKDHGERGDDPKQEFI